MFKVEFEVWDMNFHDGTGEVVFVAKTEREAHAYIRGACDNGRTEGAYDVVRIET